MPSKRCTIRPRLPLCNMNWSTFCRKQMLGCWIQRRYRLCFNLYIFHGSLVWFHQNPLNSSKLSSSCRESSADRPSLFSKFISWKCFCRKGYLKKKKMPTDQGLPECLSHGTQNIKLPFWRGEGLSNKYNFAFAIVCM